MLEEKLCEYSGTLIVVSHDREFLDNVVTSTIVFEENGEVREYVGGYSDWLRQGHRLTETDNPLSKSSPAPTAEAQKPAQKPNKLSYKDQRELDLLPGEIDTLEARVSELQTRIATPGYYEQDEATVRAGLDELAAAEAELEARIDRWGELEALRESYEL